jgi:hypothetical protein
MKVRFDHLALLAGSMCILGTLVSTSALGSAVHPLLDDCDAAAMATHTDDIGPHPSTHSLFGSCAPVPADLAARFDMPMASHVSPGSSLHIDGARGFLAKGGSGALIRWISNSNGNWHLAANWVDGALPSDGDTAGFGLDNADFQVEVVDIDNAGNGVFLSNSLLRIERKMIFSDASADGDPALADDSMTFSMIEANGLGGSAAEFNVPVTADTVSSNRHGAVFNREITVTSILARSAHQDRWQINASSTLPIVYLLIDEERGPDGDSIDGSFSINSDLHIEHVEQVWGRLVVGADATASVGRYLYSSYVNQTENNNINPITLDGTLRVSAFTVHDIALDTLSDLAAGSYGRTGNENATFEVDFISGDGVLLVLGPDEMFSDGFEPELSPGS